MLRREVNQLLSEQRRELKAGQVRKSDIDRMLVDERKKMREAHKQSRFMQRTLQIYNHQKDRAEELKAGPLPYTLEEFREQERRQIDEGCPYCKIKLTVNSMVNDHRNPVSRGGTFTLDNTVACCKPCNCQKGKMNVEEFIAFNEFLSTLPADVVRDIRARLTTGGKWLQH